MAMTFFLYQALSRKTASAFVSTNEETIASDEPLCHLKSLKVETSATMTSQSLFKSRFYLFVWTVVVHQPCRVFHPPSAMILHAHVPTDLMLGSVCFVRLLEFLWSKSNMKEGWWFNPRLLSICQISLGNILTPSCSQMPPSSVLMLDRKHLHRKKRLCEWVWMCEWAKLCKVSS